MADTKKITIEPVAEKKPSKKEYISAVGRRRESSAQARFYQKDSMEWKGKELKKGEIYVNGVVVSEYFPGEAAKVRFLEPLRTTNMTNKFIVTIQAMGGGKNGQLDASIQAVSRALEKFDKEKLRPILKKKGFLTRDSRVRERRKVGTGGKARRKKQSPKR